MRTPQRLDARSLELHRLIARKLRAQPELFARARDTLDRWRRSVDPQTQPYLERWEAIFAEGVEHAIAVATEESQDAADLRQASPFCGILSTAERAEFFKKWRWST